MGSGLIVTAMLLFVTTGTFIILLYVVDGFRPFGMNGIWVQSRYMTYVGDEMDHIFRQRNMIIESERAEIIIRVRNIGYEDEARIQIFEDANGVSFNSINRTHVDFLEVLDEYGYPFTKILVREPSGVMRRTARVYINLKRDYSPALRYAPYNFVLNTGRSPVSFQFDPSAEFLNIENLVVHGTGQVTLPPPPTTVNPFRVNIHNLIIDSPSARVNHRGVVTGETIVRGVSNNIVLGNIQSLCVYGTRHNVSVFSATDIDFNVVGGSITVRDEARALYVRGADVNVSASTLYSFFHYTNTGRVAINSITTRTELTSVRMLGGALTLGTRGAGHGVFGNVDIYKRVGGMNVTFANDDLATGSLTIRAIDGNINVHGVRGLVDIYIPSMGDANVSIGFSRVVANSRVIIEGSREPNRFGALNVILLGADTGASLHMRGSMAIMNHIDTTTVGNCINHNHRTPTRPVGLEDWETDAHCTITSIRGGGGLLHLKTQNTITLRAGMW